MPKSCIFILGLDGLEYDFVENWNLRDLQQHQHGKLIVPINEQAQIPLTPEVWSAFLTGKIIVWHRLSILLNILSKLRKTIPLHLGLAKKLTYHAHRKVTFSAFNVPFINNDSATQKVSRQFGEGRLSLAEARLKLRKIYAERKHDIKAYAIEHHDKKPILFAYMHYPDILQHYYMLHPKVIRQHYRDLNDFVRELNNEIDSTFIILSDHGFNLKTLTHSKHGFYSTSHPFNGQPKAITDFHELLKETRIETLF